jgi:transposase InsO family protein
LPPNRRSNRLTPDLFVEPDWLDLRRGVSAEIRSISRKGSCWDGAPMEGFHTTLESEFVDQRDDLMQAEARADVFQILGGWYNCRRLPSALDYLTPEQKVAAFPAAASAAQHCP